MWRSIRWMVAGLCTLSLFGSGVVLAQSTPGMPAAGKTGTGSTLEKGKMAPGTETPQAGLVDLNTADEKTLTSLKGVGPAKAKAIMKYRQDNGGFKSVDELAKVPGFGAKTLAALKPLITVGNMGQ